MKNYASSRELIREWIDSLDLCNINGRAPYPLKKIIHGTTYNTKTATLLATYDYDKSIHDSSENLCEDLYQTKSGKFFLVGDGQGHSPYSAAIPGWNDYERGHILLPLDVDQVKTWLEMRDLVDEYEEIFGSADADDVPASAYTFTLRLPTLLSQKLKDSLSENESIQSFIQNSIESEIAKRKETH